LLPCLFEKANGDAKAGFQSDSLSNVFLGSNLGYLVILFLSTIPRIGVEKALPAKGGK